MRRLENGTDKQDHTAYTTIEGKVMSDRTREQIEADTRELTAVIARCEIKAKELKVELAALSEPKPQRLYKGMHCLFDNSQDGFEGQSSKAVLVNITIDNDEVWYNDNNGCSWPNCIPDPDADNFIEWGGGECPIDWSDEGISGILIEVKTGSVRLMLSSNHMDWSRDIDDDIMIIAYRIIRKPEWLS